MKILVVSYLFPPNNLIGAVRVGKFAKYLYKHGHDVRVIAAPPGADTSLPLEIPEENVVLAEDWNIDALFDPLVALFRRRRGPVAAAASPAAVEPPQLRNGVLVTFLRRHYYACLRIPDSRAGWHRNAVSAGNRLLAHWQPDLIFASSPPTISLYVAAALGKRFGVPWIAELRDLWTDNPYYPFPLWRKALDRVLEMRLLRKPAAMVTVSPPWARTLESKYDQPVSIVLNGYAEEDCEAAPPYRTNAPGPLSVVYTGNIYRGFRDPSPLFAAITRLSPAERESITVDFYGSSVAEVRDLVQRFGVGDCVAMRSAVAYHESLELQRQADVLLLLQWNDPRDAGNIPAKFFEYVAAGRPILMLGYENGVLAGMVRERGAGVVCNEPAAIATQLSDWIGQRRNGGVPGLAPASKAGLSRREQFQKLELLLHDVTARATHGR